MYIAAAMAKMIRRIVISVPPRNTVDQLCRNVTEMLLLQLYSNRMRPGSEPAAGVGENVKRKDLTLFVLLFS